MSELRELVNSLKELFEASLASKLPKSHRSLVAIGPGLRKAIKRATSKKWRKTAKMDPEGAPTRRPTKGWSD